MRLTLRTVLGLPLLTLFAAAAAGCSQPALQTAAPVVQLSDARTGYGGPGGLYYVCETKYRFTQGQSRPGFRYVCSVKVRADGGSLPPGSQTSKDQKPEAAPVAGMSLSGSQTFKDLPSEGTLIVSLPAVIKGLREFEVHLEEGAGEDGPLHRISPVVSGKVQ